jgi:hypothetical protein
MVRFSRENLYPIHRYIYLLIKYSFLVDFCHKLFIIYNRDFYLPLKNSLIIHEENTKEMNV